MAGSHPSHELPLDDLRWLHALARRLVGDPHLAEDVVQDTVLRALERSPRNAGSLRAWLRTILRNVVRQEWRRSARRSAREVAAAPAECVPATLEVVEELALHRRLVEEVDALDEPYRTAIVLRFLRGRTPNEIAGDLGVPVKTVHTRIERGIATLRGRIGRDRGAWLLFLGLERVRPEPIALGLTELLLPMKLKTIAALLCLFLVGTLLYLREPVPEAPSEATAKAEGSVLAATESAPTGGTALREQVPSEERETPAPVSSPRASPPAPAVVQGFVRELDGHGLAGIEIVFERGSGGTYAREGDGARARSGAQGSFALPVPEIAGRFTTDDQDYTCIVAPQLDGGAPLEPPIVVVAPSRTYAGRVVDVEGAPIAGARVEITLDGSFLQSMDVGGSAVHLLLPFAEQDCDKDGRFRFEHAGAVAAARIVAQADGFQRASIEEPPYSELGLELVLQRVQPDQRTIHGLVLDDGGAVVAGAQVSLGGVAVATDGAGRFALECESWRRSGWLRAVKRGALPATLSFADALRPSSPEAPLVLHLGAAPSTIRGLVRDHAGEPVAGAMVWTPDTTPFGSVLQQEGENSFLGEITVEAYLTGRIGPWESSVSARTDAQGRFELVGLEERAYAVFALEPRTLNGAGPVECFGGDEHAEILLGAGETSAVAGRVVSRSGVPLAGVRVVLGRGFPWRADEQENAQAWSGFPVRSPEAAWTFFESAVVTDQEGRFVLPEIVTAGTFLALRGKAIVLGESFALDREKDLEALELVVSASSRFQLVLDRAGEADAFALAREPGGRNGDTAVLLVEADGVTISTPRVAIVGGRSGTVLIQEGEHEIVLYAGDVEVRRRTLTFPPGGLHELRP